MFEIIFLTLIILYIVLVFSFTLGLNRRFKKLPDNNCPSVSVIVAARNEEKNIVRCLESLDRLEYAEGKLEIIIVNDKSDDRTLELIEQYVVDKPKFKYITTKKEIGALKGKTNALANGFEISGGEIIMTTDADCSVPKLWVKTIAGYFTENVGAVCGFTTQKSYNWFSGMQAIDFSFLQSIAAGVMNLGKPITCIGNNMAFLRKAYLEVGGYENLKFSVTEDFRLLQEILALKKYNAIYPVDETSLIESNPCEDFKTLFWQKKRWGVGGLESSLFGYSIMSIGLFNSIMAIISPLYMSPTVVMLLFTMLIVDFSYLFPLMKQWKILPKLKYFLAFEIYYHLYVIILPFAVALNRKVVWKGRKY